MIFSVLKSGNVVALVVTGGKKGFAAWRGTQPSLPRWRGGAFTTLDVPVPK